MKVTHLFLLLLASSGVLAGETASAPTAVTGAGATRCTEVISRVSGQRVAERMAVLSWVQGYLTGVAAAARESRAAAAGATQIPEYDELGPRVLLLCKANPTADLYHVATQFSVSQH